jgi:hypothetical protein
MKRLMTLAFVSLILCTLVACGPSAAEIAAKQQEILQKQQEAQQKQRDADRSKLKTDLLIAESDRLLCRLNVAKRHDEALHKGVQEGTIVEYKPGSYTGVAMEMNYIKNQSDEGYAQCQTNYNNKVNELKLLYSR